MNVKSISLARQNKWPWWYGCFLLHDLFHTLVNYQSQNQRLYQLVNIENVQEKYKNDSDLTSQIIDHQPFNPNQVYELLRDLNVSKEAWNLL